MVASMDPNDSWVARWQRIEKFAKGLYAVQVSGLLPEDAVEAMEARGLKYAPRDAENVNGRAEGPGTYHFTDGTVYHGSFKDGEFHGDGALIFPDKSQYIATWNEGKLVKGEIILSDGLKYQEKEWEYCSAKDRRFQSEISSKLSLDKN